MTAKKYSLVIAHRFVKDLKRLSRPDQVRVRRALEALQADPYRGRRVKAAEIGQFQWRVGDLRIRYDISEQEIQVLRVLKREYV